MPDMPRVAITFLLACVLILCGIVPASSQGKLELHLKLARGEALAYAFARTEDASAIGPAGRARSNSKLEGLEVHRVLDRDPSGVMTVEVFQDSAKRTAEGKTEEAWRIPLTIRVTEFGVVLTRVSGVYQKPEDFPTPLPDIPVGVGDSWRRQTSVETVAADGKVTELYTLSRVDQRGEETVAHIQLRVEGVVSSRPGSGPIPGVRVTSSGKVEGSGEISWSVQRGRLLKSSTQLVVEFQVDLTYQGQSARASSTTRITEEQELLPQVPIPVLNPDELIIPGKSLGKLTLGATLPDLVAQFGQPAEEPDLGLASRRYRWSNGLVVHVSAEDAGRIVALEITDERYRTEKGIGFRSSEGAVVIAYGFEPKRVDLVSVRVGDYRVVIYDDLGIAFGIRATGISGAFGTLRDRKRSPPATVEFVVIFLPGTASQVFGQ